MGGRLAAFPPAGRGGWCVDRAAVGASAAGHSGGADRAGTGVRDRAHPTTALHRAPGSPRAWQPARRRLWVERGGAGSFGWGTSRLRRSTSTPSPSNAHGTTPLATTFRSTWPSWTPSSTSCRRHALPWSTSFVPPVESVLARLDVAVLPSRPATSPPRHRPPGWRRLAQLEARRLGADALCVCLRSAPSSASRSVATFSARFLGCKVSFADAQAIRERLHCRRARGGRGGRRRRRRQHLLRDSRGGLEVAAGGVSSLAHHARVYVTGCGASLAGAFADAENVVVVARRARHT